ncbi:hypoxia induced protein conserved region-domain-containing protein [Xylariaceae sp. FL0594]|nr:hypoxia induced protein conserved region-domain-containing protein [Xylariaceae sp. FL0594]
MADRRPMPSSFDEDKNFQENGWQKISRKLKEEPLVPLGAFLTVFALFNAWRGMRRGDHEAVQRSFRARVVAQGFTIAAILLGSQYYREDRQKRAELIKLEAQRKAEERHQKWLRELEVRDQEDRDLQTELQKKRERVEAKRAKAAAAAKAEAAEKEKEKDPQLVSPPPSTTAATATTSSSPAVEQPSEEGNKSSKVLGALSAAGGWFGSKKGESSESADDAKSATPDAESLKAAANSSPVDEKSSKN